MVERTEIVPRQREKHQAMVPAQHLWTGSGGAEGGQIGYRRFALKPYKKGLLIAITVAFWSFPVIGALRLIFG